MTAGFRSLFWPALRAAVASGAVLLGGCQSPMYSGTPDEPRASVAPDYAPGTYEPPAKVGGNYDADDEEASAEAQPSSEEVQKYEYRGGRDPITGRAKTQM